MQEKSKEKKETKLYILLKFSTKKLDEIADKI